MENRSSREFEELCGIHVFWEKSENTYHFREVYPLDLSKEVKDGISFCVTGIDDNIANIISSAFSFICDAKCIINDCKSYIEGDQAESAEELMHSYSSILKYSMEKAQGKYYRKGV